MEHSGRLELTWTNKHKRLLAHDDRHYEWVDPADYRVSEVRCSGRQDEYYNRTSFLSFMRNHSRLSM